MGKDAPPRWDRRMQQRLARGEAAALGELYDRFAALVHSQAHRVLDDDAAADQVTREVFGYVWENPDAYDPRQGSMRFWVARLTHDQAVHRLREQERAAGDDLSPPDVLPSPPPEPLAHGVLKSLLGAWALAACSAEETAAVEEHLTGCAPCAEEALRLRDAVGLLHTDRDLDLDPLLRSRVLENCLGRRPARTPVPAWAGAYDAETARLDALLRDIGDSEWHAPVRLKWFDGEAKVSRRTTVAGVIGHLMSVDGLVASALGLGDPAGPDAPTSPAERTERLWSSGGRPVTRSVRVPWREQSHALVRTVSFAGLGVEQLSVSYGDFALPLQDAMLDRAFECWVHADDIAAAVDYPYA
ncbi:sigma factor, partial [[Kitasatospora] papulosa]|uniref:sigma factor n=1 Tax=[Kitasatospora] papulosa TaxID=1464011 RepID=UPI0036C64C8C